MSSESAGESASITLPALINLAEMFLTITVATVSLKSVTPIEEKTLHCLENTSSPMHPRGFAELMFEKAWLKISVYVISFSLSDEWTSSLQSQSNRYKA